MSSEDEVSLIRSEAGFAATWASGAPLKTTPWNFFDPSWSGTGEFVASSTNVPAVPSTEADIFAAKVDSADELRAASTLPVADTKFASHLAPFALTPV